MTVVYTTAECIPGSERILRYDYTIKNKWLLIFWLTDIKNTNEPVHGAKLKILNVTNTPKSLFNTSLTSLV